MTFFDRKSAGPLADKALSELVVRLFKDRRALDTEILSYEVTSLELEGSKRGHQPTRAHMVLTYQLKPTKGKVILTVPNRELTWIHRHGGWFLGRGPR